jgi:hypothetical protein
MNVYRSAGSAAPHSQVRRAASDAPVLSVLSVRVTTGMFIV